MSKSGFSRLDERPVVLFVDDDEKMLEAYRERFTLLEYQVLIASRPSDAIELVQNHPVDIAVLDIKMPEMDGYRLIQALRKIHPELPVVFLTGKQDLDTTFRTFQLKSNGLIEKPCLPQQLDYQLRRIIESTRMRAAG